MQQQQSEKVFAHMLQLQQMQDDHSAFEARELKEHEAREANEDREHETWEADCHLLISLLQSQGR